MKKQKTKPMKKGTIGESIRELQKLMDCNIIVQVYCTDKGMSILSAEQGHETYRELLSILSKGKPNSPLKKWIKDIDDFKNGIQITKTK